VAKVERLFGKFKVIFANTSTWTTVQFIHSFIV